MGQNSKIEWTHHTFNPWRGCTKVSEGCQHCYAETMSGRNPSTLGVWGPKGTRVVAAEAYWRQPAKWNAEAKEAGERRRVFCASLADVFEGEESMPGASVDAVEEARARLWQIITCTPHLDWLLLTKRPRNIMHMVPHWWKTAIGFPRNVWIGVSVENQAAADERIPHLAKVPAYVTFLSCEPLLGLVDISKYLTCQSYLHGQVMPCTCTLVNWVIVGGESGGKARPMHPHWARSLQEQCQDAGVPFLFKQWGEFAPTTRTMAEVAASSRPLMGVEHSASCPYPIALVDRVGKKAAGRMLDGREHNGFPA
jgi:protein gp37